MGWGSFLLYWLFGGFSFFSFSFFPFFPGGKFYFMGVGLDSGVKG